MRAIPLTLAILLLATALPAADARSHDGPGRGRALAEAQSASALANETPGGNSTLVVMLNATGGDGNFSFVASGPGLGNFTLSTANGTAQAGFGNLSAHATYNVTSLSPAGWRIVSSSCDAGAPHNLTLPANGTATCWFVHERLAALAVQVASEGGNGTFPFQGTGAGLPVSFNVTTTNGTGFVRLANLAPGENLSVEALVPEGWDLVNASCVGNLTLAPAQEGACSYRFARETLLRVVVTSLGGSGTFPFSANGTGMPASFNVTTANGTGSASFVLPPHATVNASLQLPAGWKLRSGGCSHVTVAPNETATCSFTVARLAQIRASLATTGGDGSFVLHVAVGGAAPDAVWMNTTNGSAWINYTSLDPDANYTLTLGSPSGWHVAASPCVNVTPGPAGNVSCAFRATRLGAVAGRVLNATGGAGLAGFVVYADEDRDGVRDAAEPNATTNATGHWWIGGLPAGNHTLRVGLPAPWRAVEPGSGARVVRLDAGGFVDGVDFRVANATRQDHDHGHGHGHDGKDGDRAPGGGRGYWKNWDHHLDRAQVDAWVARLHAASAWLMPGGHAANADGLAALLRESKGQCRRDHGAHACDAHRLAGDYLVTRLNLETGRIAWNDTREIHGERARATGLDGTFTWRQIVDAFEAKAGQPLGARQTKAWTSLFGAGDG